MGPLTLPRPGGWTAALSLRGRLVVLLCFWDGWFWATARAQQTAPPLNARQQEIARAVSDKLIAEIEALKPKYPELAGFGTGPELVRIAGGFRYDHRVEKVHVTSGEPLQERPLPGGCFIYFRLLPRGDTAPPMAQPPELTDYGTWFSVGGLRAGLEHQALTALYQKSHGPNDDDALKSVLSQDLAKVIQHVLDTTFARLTAEYDLSRGGVDLSVPALMAAATSRESGSVDTPFESVSENAFTALRFRRLAPGQLAQIRAGIRDGKYPPSSMSTALQIIQEQDKADLPGFLTDLVAASLKTEQVGKDTFRLTPFTAFNPWQSDAAEARQAALAALPDNDPRFLPVAALILSTDTVSNNRSNALDYITRQPGGTAHKLALAALANSFRTIQAEAAEAAGNGKWRDAEPGLRGQLSSPAPRVRKAAVAALKQLGIDVPPPTAPPLPDSARQVAATLWRLGLNDDDLRKSHLLTNINAPLAPAVDAPAMEAQINSYIAEDNQYHHPVPWNVSVPAPFLLAAAEKLQDEAAAQRIYGYLCDQYETDDFILADALNELGWDRFAEGLDQFHRREDQAALASLAQVMALNEVARPFSLLGIYIKQSRELTDFIRNPPAGTSAAEPDRHDTAAYVTYWIGQLGDCDGSTPSPAGEKIRQVGLPAIPFLIEALSNHTLTRNFSYWRSYAPSRDFVCVGDAALNVLYVIASDYGLTPPRQPFRTQVASPATQEKLRAWFASLPPHPQPVPPKQRQPALLYPAGRYFWGDD